MMEPPTNLQYGPVRLVFGNHVEPDPSRGLVPFYRFEVFNADDQVVGHISFKVGSTFHILQCAGHIGYQIEEQYRGNNFSYFSCLALKPFIKTQYDEVIITSDPQNLPSIRVIEKLGAKRINEIVVPENDPAYENGSRTKIRYLWKL